MLLASPEQNIARVQQRVALGGHNVPDDVLRRRYLKSIKNFVPVCQMSDSWVLYYNGDKKIVEIARGDKKTNTIFIDCDGNNIVQIANNTTLEEILKLANRGARVAQSVARQNGINPVFEKLLDINENTR